MSKPLMEDVVRAFLEAIDGQGGIIATGVGSHQQVVARELARVRVRSFLTSAGHGTMGFGLPAAIGAAITCPEARVILFDGDGSFIMGMPSLVTAVERGLRKIVAVILDNESYGIVRQFEELQGFNTFATADLLNPNFADIASACGWPSTYEFLDGDLGMFARRVLASPGPTLAHVRVADHAVWPIMEGGKRPDEMTQGVPIS